MTAALVVSLVLNIALIIGVFLIAVLFSRTLADTVRLVDRQHERDVRQQNSLLDRIMSADWGVYREARAEDDSEDGGQIFPSTDNDDVGELIVTQLSEEQLRQLANERQLMMEDFPDDQDR